MKFYVLKFKVIEFYLHLNDIVIQKAFEQSKNSLEW